MTILSSGEKSSKESATIAFSKVRLIRFPDCCIVYFGGMSKNRCSSMLSLPFSLTIFVRIDLVEACRFVVKKISASERMIFFMMVKNGLIFYHKLAKYIPQYTFIIQSVDVYWFSF